MLHFIFLKKKVVKQKCIEHDIKHLSFKHLQCKLFKNYTNFKIKFYKSVAGGNQALPQDHERSTPRTHAWRSWCGKRFIQVELEAVPRLPMSHLPLSHHGISPALSSARPGRSQCPESLLHIKAESFRKGHVACCGLRKLLDLWP